jgi:hypothetical protein
VNELDKIMNKKEEPKIPTGLIRREKTIDESQMADFATPIDEVFQNEIMGPPVVQQKDDAASPPIQRAQGGGKKGGKKNPFGLKDDQYQALLAGIAAVIAFSKPVQLRLSSAVPKFLNDAGDVSLTGLAVTALIAAVLFYFAKQYLSE